MEWNGTKLASNCLMVRLVECDPTIGMVSIDLEEVPLSTLDFSFLARGTTVNLSASNNHFCCLL